MLRPPMKNEAVIVSANTTGQPDRYGRKPKSEMTTEARVAFSTQIIRQADGTQREARLEVDLPPQIILSEGDEIRAKDSQGVWHTAQIISIDDATNFSGSRIMYRTVLCG